MKHESVIAFVKVIKEKDRWACIHTHIQAVESGCLATTVAFTLSCVLVLRCMTGKKRRLKRRDQTVQLHLKVSRNSTTGQY